MPPTSVRVGRFSAPLFVARLSLAFRSAELTDSAQAVAIAHGGLETGWGASAAARLGHNFWNLSAGPKWMGDVVPGPDKEPDGKGGWRKITQRWRAYGTDVDAVHGYLTFLRLNYPRSYTALLAGDPSAFVAGLRDDPETPKHERNYFTADPVRYAKDLLGCLRTVRSLLGLSPLPELA